MWTYWIQPFGATVGGPTKRLGAADHPLIIGFHRTSDPHNRTRLGGVSPQSFPLEFSTGWPGLAKCSFCSLKNAFLGQMFFIFRKYYILNHKTIISWPIMLTLTLTLLPPPIFTCTIKRLELRWCPYACLCVRTLETSRSSWCWVQFLHIYCYNSTRLTYSPSWNF